MANHQLHTYFDGNRIYTNSNIYIKDKTFSEFSFMIGQSAAQYQTYINVASVKISTKPIYTDSTIAVPTSLEEDKYTAYLFDFNQSTLFDSKHRVELKTNNVVSFDSTLSMPSKTVSLKLYPGEIRMNI